MTGPAATDPFEARFALGAGTPLAAFNRAGVLAAADVHVAGRLAALARVEDPLVALAAALAVRAPRLGSVYVDLATVRVTATSELEEPVDLDALAWPEPGAWVAAVAASPLVHRGEDEPVSDRPLRLVGTRLYLDRYWREEVRVAADLRALAGAPAPPVDAAALRAGLDRLFADDPAGAQARAAAAAVERRFAVVAGGPGTGKTTTVARLLALLLEPAGASAPPAPLVALAAPTGKAAARLGEAVHDEAHRLPLHDDVRRALLALEASTLHRLLGRRAGSTSRFRHHRDNRLPHDVVIVDETSMVSLSMMARLVEAVRPGARLVLVGDPGQLTSIEAGAVLGDVVGDGRGEGIVVLDRVHRFGGAIADLAVAIRGGDPDAVVEVLRGGDGAVAWIEADPAEAPDLPALREPAVAGARAVIDAARAGDAPAALAALGAFRLLCAHRRGPHGAATWARRMEGWLAAELGDLGADPAAYAGRPLLVTENDYALRLYNGDTGVVVAQPDGSLAAAFERRGEVVAFHPTRLAAVETPYAMTIHKAQGSQFGTAAVLLPPPESRLLTRELLYTAVTRARSGLVLVGTEAAVRAAVARPIARASGLRERLTRASGSP
jgi:exodeoxyribonuclease V alpha subunit